MMKSTARFTTYIRRTASVAIVAGFISILLIQCTQNQSDDYCPDPGFGLTTLRGRVLDSLSGELLDSVQITIHRGMSWDRYLDTLVKQTDSLWFSFTTTRDCEPYFYTLSNKYYWEDFENHPAYKVGINKGEVSTFEIRFKRAAFLKLIVQQDSADTSYLELEYRKKNTKQWNRWTQHIYPAIEPDLFRAHSDSGSYHTISNHATIEGDVDYEYRWIINSKQNGDTVIGKFKAIAFDTIPLSYTFRN